MITDDPVLKFNDIGTNPASTLNNVDPTLTVKAPNSQGDNIELYHYRIKIGCFDL